MNNKNLIVNIREKLNKIEECQVAAATTPVSTVSGAVEPDLQTSMNINFTTIDGTNVSKSFEDINEFVNMVEKVRTDSNIKSYSISMTEYKSEVSANSVNSCGCQ